MSMRRLKIISLAILALLAIGVVAMIGVGRGNGESAALLRPDDQEKVALGQQVYTANCASCHGAELQGQAEDWRSPGPDGLMPAPPHDETGHTWHHPDELLFKITKLGVAEAANLKDYTSAMPAYEAILSDEEIVAVLSYIKSTWPDEIRAGHDEMNKRYALEPRDTR